MKKSEAAVFLRTSGCSLMNDAMGDITWNSPESPVQRLRCNLGNRRPTLLAYDKPSISAPPLGPEEPRPGTQPGRGRTGPSPTRERPSDVFIQLAGVLVHTILTNQSVQHVSPASFRPTYTKPGDITESRCSPITVDGSGGVRDPGPSIIPAGPSILAL